MYLDEGSKISYEAPKMDIVRPSYEWLKFTKRIEVYRNHKRLTGCTEKIAYARTYHFSQILSHLFFWRCYWNKCGKTVGSIFVISLV